MKNIFDFIISLLGIIFLSPFLVILGLIILFAFGSPVFFIQSRPGFLGKPFNFFKFRTMTNKKDKNGNLLPDKNRLSPLGLFLRRTSLDELPSLWNVLKGDMSLVGPRPLLKEYIKHYTPEQFRRHDVKPGITGWAQVNGRNTISWEEKFILDIWYVDNESLFLYFKILIMTILKVFTGEGVSPKDRPIMKKFNG